MKRIAHVLALVLAISAVLLSACGAVAAVSAPSTSGGGDKPQLAPVEFTGIIESIDGNQWTVGGKTLTVDPAVVRDGPFSVGETVKVEVQVQADGSMVVSRVEAPATDPNSNDANMNDVNSNDVNSNDANSNEINSNDVNSNDANMNDVNSNDDNGNASNINDDNSNGSNSNDDNGNDSSSNDNSSMSSNSNSDDHGGNSGSGNGGGNGGGGDNGGSGGGSDSGGGDD